MSNKFLNNLPELSIQSWKERISSKFLPLLEVMWIRSLAVVGLSLWGFVTIAQQVVEQKTEDIDTAILQAIGSLHTPLLNQIAIAVTFLGKPEVLTYLSLGFAIVLLVRRRWLEAITLVFVARGGIALIFWLKDFYGRDRPELWERIVEETSYSFPSAHAAISLIILGFIAYCLINTYRPWQNVILTVTILLVGAIGFTRLYLGVHWPSDVLAGYAAGLVWLIPCILGVEIVKSITRKE